MQRKHRYPLDWYYSPLWHHKYVFTAGILTFLWWVWLFPIFLEATKGTFTSFLAYAVCMSVMWFLALLIVYGIWKSRLKPDEIDEDYYQHMLEEAEKRKQREEKEAPKITVEDSSCSEDGHHGSTPTNSVANSAQNTPSMYNARTGRESMDYDHRAAVSVLTTVEKQTKKTEEVEMNEGQSKTKETSPLSSSWGSDSEDELQPELSVDDENDIDAPQRVTLDKSLTPRQIFFSDLLRHSVEPVPRDRRSLYMDRPQMSLAEKRKSMPLYLYIGETRTLSYSDQEAVTEDARKTLTSTSDSDKQSLSSPAQHVTHDELHSNMIRFRDEQQSQRATSDREKHSSTSSGAEYFIANVAKPKSVTSEVFITIDEPKVSVNRNVHEFAVVGSGEGQKLVAVIDEQRATSGDNDDALSDCVFLDEGATGK